MSVLRSCCGLAVSCLPVTTVAAQADPGAPGVVAAAFEIGLAEPRALELPETGVEAVARAADVEVDVVERAKLFAATHGERDVRLARVEVPQSSPPAWAVIALGADRSFVAAAVVDAGGAVIDEWRHFMRGLKFHDVPRLEGAAPRSALAARRAAAEGGAGVDARLTVALLDMLQHMNAQAAVFNLPKNPDRDPGEESRMMAAEFAAVAELAPGMAPVLGGAAERFVAIARDASASAAALADAADARDRQAAREHQRAVMRSCKACHDLPAQGGQELRELSTRHRVRLGIGDGYYQVGHDLRIRHPDRQRAQRVADALRVGALLIDAAAAQ